MEMTLRENEDGSLIVPLPDEVLNKLEANEGDVLDVRAVDGKLHISRPENALTTIIDKLKRRKKQLLKHASRTERAYQAGALQVLDRVSERFEAVESAPDLDRVLDDLIETLNGLRGHRNDSTTLDEIRQASPHVEADNERVAEEFNLGALSAYSSLIDRFNTFHGEWNKALHDDKT